MTNRTIGHQPAFPQSGYDDQTPVFHIPGLTKREFFAALAMAGMLATNDMSYTEAAEYGFRAADALIEALNSSAQATTTTTTTED